MFQKLVSHNSDIEKLVSKGYAVAFDSNCMIIRDIPYLNEEKQLSNGTIVTKLVFKDLVEVTQDNHQIFFAGTSPYGLNGTPIPNLGDSAATLILTEAFKDITVQRSFSNKPSRNGKFNDFFEKIESYVSLISGPAIELYQANPYTFKCVKDVNMESVFKLHDTLTSRAEITDLSARFQNEVIAIIGVGGTGSYLLDFLAKTPVSEIKLFDVDLYHVHNSFRSPGMIKIDELNAPKVEVFKSRYENFRKGITAHSKFIDSSCTEDLVGVTFAFVCIDKGSSRNEVFDLLITMRIPFIDVGMGLNRKNNSIDGMLRTTYFSSTEGQIIKEKNLAPFVDNPDDLYRANIQISELNALNASLAVIKYKQLRGFYFEEIPSYHLLFNVGDLKIVEESQ